MLRSQQDVLHLMCSLSHLLCVVFLVITSIPIQIYNVNCEQEVEKETIFYVTPWYECRFAVSSDHFAWSLLSFTLVLPPQPSLILSLLISVSCMCHFVFPLPSFARGSLPLVVGGALAYSSTLPACLKNKPPHRQEGGSTMPRSILTHRVLRFTDEVTVR